MARRWPFYVSLSLGLIPVFLFGAMTAMLLIKSAPALVDPGVPNLVGRTFASQYSNGGVPLCTFSCQRSEYDYGLLPAAWGTLLITGTAMLIALPASLALALVCSEFTLGPVGRVMRTMLGILGGIPSIVYALLAIFFVKQFMIPKFSANMTFDAFDPTKIGVPADKWPASGVPWNAGAMPWDLTGFNNSTLLGAILIALLVIPFMAPLIDDAIRGVSTSMKEASFGLGANRWHTMRRVTLPAAMPGILSAVSLGTLRAMGDTLIVVFVVGWEANVIPNPPIDLAERTPGLTAVSAGLLGGFQGNAACHGASCDVGYLMATILLIAAVAIVGVTSFLQARLRARYEQ